MNYNMSVKVKISYEKPQELKKVFELLHPIIKSYKIQEKGKGSYKRAYVEIKPVDEKLKI